MSNHSEGFVPTITATTAAVEGVLNLHGVYGIDEIMVDILSRLPPKSLMRFKCIRKSWLSLIQKNKHFFSLHSCCRSKLNKKILIRSNIYFNQKHLRSSFLTLDLFKRSTQDVTKIPHTWDGKHVLGPVNGLLCFVNSLEGCKASVLIYNLCTKEASPWITSNIWKSNSGSIDYISPLSGFGFDHVTQEHKVLFVWRKKKAGGKEVICEVLTVGENTWRTTHQVLPVIVFDYRDPVYLNGSIYWFRGNFRPDKIIAFDVGKEKLRLIKPPPYGITYGLSYEFILEVDGQLAIMKRMVYDNQKKVTEMRLWSYNNYKWIFGGMIELPFCMKNDEIHIIKSIPGKDLFLITNLTADSGEPPFIYLYDMKKKKYIEYGSLPRPGNKLRKYFILSVLEESIYPVGAQLASQDYHDQMITTSPPPPLVDTKEWSNTGIVINLCFLGLFSALYVFRK